MVAAAEISGTYPTWVMIKWSPALTEAKSTALAASTRERENIRTKVVKDCGFKPEVVDETRRERREKMTQKRMEPSTYMEPKRPPSTPK